MARQSVWSNPEVQKLLAEFVPAADEVWGLQHRKDPESQLFNKIAEQGHYAGRTTPTDTRQGTYAAAPSGVLLASINSNSAQAMADMLRRALNKWNSMPESERYLAEQLPPETGKGRPEARYPKDGLVLRETVRDLPREQTSGDWRARAWNKDYAWFKKDEARSFLPSLLKAGESNSVPRPILMRLARFNMIDTVRGQSFNYPENAIQKVELVSTIEKVAGTNVEVRFVGVAKAEQEGTWPIAGYQDMNKPTQQKRGYDFELAGVATWDTAKDRFVKFELVAAGKRWGATQYNGRSDDPGPAPIGYLYQIASDAPHDKVPPSEFWSYGWR